MINQANRTTLAILRRESLTLPVAIVPCGKLHHEGTNEKTPPNLSPDSNLSEINSAEGAISLRDNDEERDGDESNSSSRNVNYFDEMSTMNAHSSLCDNEDTVNQITNEIVHKLDPKHGSLDEKVVAEKVKVEVSPPIKRSLSSIISTYCLHWVKCLLCPFSSV